MERLSKFLARSGVASRRTAEEIIRSGLVSVNGCRIFEPQHLVSQETDRITVAGKVVSPPSYFVYIALNKPAGYISDLRDPKGRVLARSLLPNPTLRLFPVGRLDYTSEGLMLFTNDGDFAQRTMHPKYEVEKEYHVKFQGLPTYEEQRVMERGVVLDGVCYRIKSISFLKPARTNNWYQIIATEGRNRMIRKIAEHLGHRILKLKRVRIGEIVLGKIKPGEFRYLSRAEINKLINI